MLTLTLTEYRDSTHWHWRLADEHGCYLGDSEVSLSHSDLEYRGFENLPAYLRNFAPLRSESDLLAEVGAWMASISLAALPRCCARTGRSL